MEDGPDIDLIVPLENRTLNLYIEDMPPYIDNRIQLLDIRNVLIRFTTLEDNNYSTIHFLRSIDLKSATMNFVFNYEKHYIKLEKEEYSARLLINKK